MMNRKGKKDSTCSVESVTRGIKQDSGIKSGGGQLGREPVSAGHSGGDGRRQRPAGGERATWKSGWRNHKGKGSRGEMSVH